MANTKSQYRRATEYVEGIGSNLESIANVDVILRKVSINERDMRGEKRTFVLMQISPMDNEEEVNLFHAWSDSLAEKLSEIPEDAFPVVVKFTRVATSGGFRVWTFE